MTPLCLPGILPSAPARMGGEGGFLMASAAVIILVFVSIMGSFAFVFTRDFDHKINFATGERLAEVAVMAHSYAQLTHYRTAPVTSLDALGNLYTPAFMSPPDNLAFDTLGRADLELTIRGRDVAPLNGLAPAPSAYLHLKIRPRGAAIRRPTENVSFMAGAASRGMGRLGIVGINTGEPCEGAPARVRWGPESTACLNDAQIALIGFNDVQNGDVIAPAWEAALARVGENVIMRYPQPERPDMNAMNVDLAFAPNPARPGRGHGIGDYDGGTDTVDMASGAGELNTDFVDQAQAMATIGDFRNEMVVRQGNTINMNGPAITNSDFTILDTGGAPIVLEVAGGSSITGDVSVSETFGHTTGPLEVTIDTDTRVDRVGVLGAPGTGQAVTVNPIAAGPPVTVAVEDVSPASTIRNVSAGGDFSVAGNFDTTAATIRPDNAQPLDIFAAELITEGTAQINNTGDWDIGSIDQRGAGPTHALRVQNLRATRDCIGIACPDHITDPPNDLPF